MEYDTYSYHCSKHITTPNRARGNIKGVELEISDYDSGWLLDELIDEGVLTVPETEDMPNENDYVIAVEEDGSVYKELVFRASCNATILKGVKALESKLHNEICNNHGTSCHIHINMNYLESIGVSRLDILKATEFMAPILYSISGRDTNSINNWANSIIGEIESNDLLKRARKVDTLDDPFNGRYCIVNCNPTNTVEIRIFSNYYNFDYEYIKMYLETVDFIIDTASAMVGESYKENYEWLIEQMKEFFSKRKYRNIVERHAIDGFFVGEKERRIINLKAELRYLREEFKHLNERIERADDDECILLLRVLRGYNSRYRKPKIKFNIMDFDINKIENTLISTIEEEIENLSEE